MVHYDLGAVPLAARVHNNFVISTCELTICDANSFA